MGLSLKTKKRLTVVAQSVFFFFGGVEYAVVLPTLNAYLGQLDGDALFFGIVMAAFSFGAVITSPIYGLIQDHTRKTKVLILFGNLWEIGGNFLYFYGGSKYVLLSSRFIAGIGAGVGSTIFAQISRTSTEAERASAIAVASAARQVGLILGPALNLPLSACDFYIGPLHVNQFSGPGILMSILFVILEVTMLFCFYDIPPLTEQSENCNSQSNSAVVGQIQAAHNSVHDELNPDCDGHLHNSLTGQSSEVTPIYTDDHSQNAYRVLRSGRVAKDDENSPAVNPRRTVSKLDVFLTEEVLVLLTGQFVFLFNQTCLETALTVMTKRLLDFGGVANSILFAIAGVELLLSFVVIKFISKFVSDRAMLLGSLTVEFLPFVLLLTFYPKALPGLNRNLWWFAILFCIQVSGLAFLFISIISLFSKVTPTKMQGFAHGVRRSVGGVGTIMGPLWAGSIEYWPYETLSVMLALFVLVWGMCLLSWKRLRPHSILTAEPRSPETASSDETNPLLANDDRTDYGVA